MPAHVFHGMCQSLTDNGTGERCVDGLGRGPLPHRVYKRSIHAATEHMLPIACGPHTLQLSICFLLHVDHTHCNWAYASFCVWTTHTATGYMLTLHVDPHTLQLSICFLLHVDPESHTIINWDGILIRADWLHLIYP